MTRTCVNVWEVHLWVTSLVLWGLMFRILRKLVKICTPVVLIEVTTWIDVSCVSVTFSPPLHLTPIFFNNRLEHQLLLWIPFVLLIPISFALLQCVIVVYSSRPVIGQAGCEFRLAVQLLIKHRCPVRIHWITDFGGRGGSILHTDIKNNLLVKFGMHFFF